MGRRRPCSHFRWKQWR